MRVTTWATAACVATRFPPRPAAARRPSARRSPGVRRAGGEDQCGARAMAAFMVGSVAVRSRTAAAASSPRDVVDVARSASPRCGEPRAHSAGDGPLGICLRDTTRRGPRSRAAGIASSRTTASGESAPDARPARPRLASREVQTGCARSRARALDLAAVPVNSGAAGETTSAAGPAARRVVVIEAHWRLARRTRCDA